MPEYFAGLSVGSASLLQIAPDLADSRPPSLTTLDARSSRPPVLLPSARSSQLPSDLAITRLPGPSATIRQRSTALATPSTRRVILTDTTSHAVSGAWMILTATHRRRRMTTTRTTLATTITATYTKHNGRCCLKTTKVQARPALSSRSTVNRGRRERSDSQEGLLGRSSSSSTATTSERRDTMPTVAEAA